MDQDSIPSPRPRLVVLSLLLYAMGLLALTVVLPSCSHDDMAAPSTVQADDHGGHGNDDPPGDDHGND